MEILDDVHLRIGLTHSFIYYSGCDVIPTDGTSWGYVITPSVSICLFYLKSQTLKKKKYHLLFFLPDKNV